MILRILSPQDGWLQPDSGNVNPTFDSRQQSGVAAESESPCQNVRVDPYPRAKRARPAHSPTSAPPTEQDGGAGPALNAGDLIDLALLRSELAALPPPPPAILAAIAAPSSAVSLAGSRSRGTDGSSDDWDLWGWACAGVLLGPTPSHTDNASWRAATPALPAQAATTFASRK